MTSRLVRIIPGFALTLLLAVAAPAALAAAVQSGTWAKTGSMTTPRQGQMATLLASGRVLVVNGGSAGAELYNPATGKWTATGSPAAPASGYTTTLLPNGQVLLAGGDQDGTPATATSSAELYNPATGTWADDGAASPSAERDFTAVLLNNGQVLISGGLTGTYPAKVHVQADATLFDPATGTVTSTGSMSIPRAFHTLTVLRNGQVLATGGETQNNKGEFSVTAGAELYTP